MFTLSQQILTKRAKQFRWAMLAITSAPIAGAFYLSHTHQPSPLGCPFRFFTGIPCPGCGMTRSFLAIAQADFSNALSEHVFGPVLFAACLVAITHLIAELVVGRKIYGFYQQWIRDRHIPFLTLWSLLGYYIIRLSALLKSGELLANFSHSPLGLMLLN